MSYSNVISRLYPVHNSVLGYLGPSDLVRMAKINKEYQSATNSFTRRAYSIDRQLTRFIPDPDSFRCMQSETGAIISGSFALQFFTRVYRPDTALDVFVASIYKEEVGEWLLRNGFIYVPFTRTHNKVTLTQDLSYEESIRCPGFRELQLIELLDVLDFVSEVGGVKKKVVLHVTRSSPIQTILRFPLTCLMNFITFEKAYCLYPSETLDKSTALLLTDFVFYFETLLEKYASRGFKIYGVAYDDQYRHRDARWVEDSYSFVVTLQRPRTCDSWYKLVDPVRLTSWSIVTSPGDKHSIHFQLAIYSLDDKAHPIVIYSRAMKKLIRACNEIRVPGWNVPENSLKLHRFLSDGRLTLIILLEWYCAGAWRLRPDCRVIVGDDTWYMM